MLTSIIAQSLSALPDDNYDLTDDSVEVAETVIHFSRSIIRDINPPATGAERIVRHATVSDEGNLRTYFIEGEDVYHTGRVLSTFWIRLHKQISATDASYNRAPRDLAPETQNFLGLLLNSLYDIAELSLDHQKVALDRITTENVGISEGPQIFEISGINQVCEHTELNTFKLIITRFLDRNRPIYDVELIKPYVANP